jgi:DNA-directed RNA polymerase subunit M/transcription elongation factor TFIIS
MSASQPPPSPQKFVRCPNCSERLGVRAEDAGRRARCTKCGRVFTIGGETSETKAAAAAVVASSPPATPAPPPEPPAPQWVSFSCSLCDTRLSARVAEVGSKIACPDCGRKNVVPPPPKPKQAIVPRAMSGEQFDLWGADVKTWEPGFATGASLHPVICRLCQTRMYATDEQVGRELKCPDCGALTVAVRSLPKKAPQLHPPAGEELELDPESAPAPRLAPQPSITGQSAEARASAALMLGSTGRQLGVAIKPQLVYEERPIRPPVPLLQAVWSMLGTQDMLVRWVAMSLMLGAATWLISEVVNMPKGLGWIFAIFLAIAGVGVMVMWLTFAAPTYLAIVAESSNGQRRLHEPPSWSLMDSFAEIGYFLFAVALAGMPGMIAWSIAALPRPVALGIAASSAILLFPIALLGALVENSPFGVISPKLIGTLRRCAGPWLLFYVEELALAAVVAATGIGIAYFDPLSAVIATVSLGMAASLLYMRLLGLLAWWLSDALVEPDDNRGDVDHGAAAHPNLAASRDEARAERQADIEAVARGRRAAAEAASQAARESKERGKDSRPLTRVPMPGEFAPRPQFSLLTAMDGAPTPIYDTSVS